VRKCLAVCLFNDAKNGALVRITQRQCNYFTRKLPRVTGRYSAGFEQFAYPPPDDAHAGLIEDASKLRKTPAVRNRSRGQAAKDRRDPLRSRSAHGAGSAPT
jgi:hypothetical protein